MSWQHGNKSWRRLFLQLLPLMSWNRIAITAQLAADKDLFEVQGFSGLKWSEV
jgi:hypothetical protein